MEPNWHVVDNVSDVGDGFSVRSVIAGVFRIECRRRAVASWTGDHVTDHQGSNRSFKVDAFVVAIWRNCADDITADDGVTDVIVDLKTVMAPTMVERVVQELCAGRQLRVQLIDITPWIRSWIRSATGTCSPPVMMDVGILDNNSDSVRTGARIRLERDSLHISVSALNTIYGDPLKNRVDGVNTVVSATGRFCLPSIDDRKVSPSVIAEYDWKAAAAIHVDDVQLFVPHPAALQQDVVAGLQLLLKTLHFGERLPGSAWTCAKVGVVAGRRNVVTGGRARRRRYTVEERRVRGRG